MVSHWKEITQTEVAKVLKRICAPWGDEVTETGQCYTTP
jgi:hypothetical protein